MAAICVVPSAAGTVAPAAPARTLVTAPARPRPHWIAGRRLFGRRAIHAYEGGPLAQIGGGKQLGERHAAVPRVAIVLLAIGEGELERFRHHVDVARGVVPHRAQVERFEHAEGLHEHGPLRPRRLAQDLPPREREAHRRLEARAVPGQIAGPQEPAHPLGEAADGGRDVAAIEALARRDDAGGAVSAARRVGLDEPPERAGERGLDEELAHLGHAPAGIEHGGAAGRIQIELALGLRNREEPVHVLVHREAVLGVVERRRQRVAQALGAEGLEHGEIGVDGARHRERQVSVGSRARGDAIEPALAEEADGGERGRRALPAHRQHLPRSRVVYQRDALAAERV